jgi:LacI family transcriptional regulator
LGITIIDIAEKSGVSRGTVDRVINNRGRVSPIKRDAVLAAVNELGYKPNLIARALVTGKTGIYGLTIPDLQHYIFSEVLGCVYDSVLEKGYSLLTKSVAGMRLGALHLEEIALWPVDGIIGWDCIAWLPGYLESDPANRKPVVSVGGYTIPDVDTVRIDFIDAIQEGMQYIYDKGARRIVLFNCQWSHVVGDPHYDGYTKFMDSVGLEREFIIVPHDMQNIRSTFRKVIYDYTLEHGCPDAMICYNDTAAVAARAAMRDVDLDASAKTLLVGFDGTVETEYQYPPISVVKNPVAEVSHIAADVLEARLADPNAPLIHEVITAKFIGR